MTDTYDYPAPSDEDFVKRIYEKREFYAQRIEPHLRPLTEKEIEKYRQSVCRGRAKMLSHQAFVGQFITPDTPYSGLLLYHGTGSGKTFAAVSICENFTEQVARYNTKIYIVVPGPILKEQFRHDLVTVTTNFKYMNPAHVAVYDQMSDYEKRRAREIAFRSASRYYSIISYKSFHRRVMGERFKKDGGERFFGPNRLVSLDNSVIVVDEAHNIVNNEYGAALMELKKRSKNLRIVLLTATPMRNLPGDVVPLLNCLRPLDDPVEMKRAFIGTDFDMQFTEHGKDYLRRMATGYVSFYRGGNPYTFARRVDMGEVPDDLLFTPLVRCAMSAFQQAVYERVVQAHEQDALDKQSEAAANFVFPVMENDQLVGAYGSDGLALMTQQLTSQQSRLAKKLLELLPASSTDVVYLSRVTKRPAGQFLALPHLSMFSAKFAACMKNLLTLRSGTAFVYSNLVQVGTNLFRDVLVANGFLEYRKDGRYTLLPDTRNHTLEGTYANHAKDKVFHPAIFMVVSGAGDTAGDISELSSSKVEIIQKVFNARANVDGRQIKLVLGSQVVNEGVTLENVREVHILDTHYHLGRVEQVIGRAIRQCRHMAVTLRGEPSPEVRVYRYTVVKHNNPSALSHEELMYRKAERKFIVIKAVERVLQESAVDCPLNFAANQLVDDLVQNESCHSIDEVLQHPQFKKSLCPARCEYQTCRFKCGEHSLDLAYYDRTRHIYKNILKSHLDFGTFSKQNAKVEIDFCKAVIKDLFRTSDQVSYDDLKARVQNYYPEDKQDLFDEFFLMSALTELMPVSEAARLNYSDFVVDRYLNKGFLVYEKGFYVFQTSEESAKNKPAPLARTLNTLLKSKESATQETSKLDTSFEYEPYDKEENFVVGIIGKDRSGNRVFKIRPARTKDVKRKRQTGVPTADGTVCSLGRSVKELIGILKRLGVDKGANASRKSLCKAIFERLLFLEQNAGKNGIPDKKYLILPKQFQV